MKLSDLISVICDRDGFVRHLIVERDAARAHTLGCLRDVGALKMMLAAAIAHCAELEAEAATGVVDLMSQRVAHWREWGELQEDRAEAFARQLRDLGAEPVELEGVEA